MDSAATLADLLRRRAELSGDMTAYVFLRDGEKDAESLTFAGLDRRARAMAARLQEVARTQQRALLIFPSGLEFLTALFGCFYSGLVAVPVPPPDPRRLERTLPRLRAVAADAEPAVVLTTASIKAALDQVDDRSSALEAARWITTESVEESLGEGFRCPEQQPGWLAVLQYTSGSTAAPKGVMVSHGNVLANSRYLQSAWGYSPAAVSLTWVPNFHDDGVVNGLVQPVFSGNRCIMMPPLAVVQRPIRWLRAISRYRVTHTGGPDFVYALCHRKTTAEERRGLDLSSWSMAYNAAEPVRNATLRRFYDLFQEYGFRWSTFYPAYGMAETTLIVSTRRAEDDPVLLAVDKTALENDSIVEAPAASADARTLVSSGRPILDTDVTIVDPGSWQPAPADRIGEIWVSSASVTQGYWRRPGQTAATYVAAPWGSGEGRYLRTGDLGFLRDGELFVTGRAKDLIIIRGRNLYPHDIERSVERSHPAIRAGCCAVFSVEVDGEERLVVAAEVDRRYQNDELDGTEVFRASRRAISEDHELQLTEMVLLAPGTLPKTSSGKLQRLACRGTFLAGRLQDAARWSSRELSGSAGQPAAAPRPSEAESDEPGAEAGLADWIREYAEERINSRLIDQRRSIPPSVVLDFGNRGLLGLQTARSYGGLDLGYRATARVLEQLAAVDLTLATFVTGHNLLGLRPIARYAAGPLREKLLPELARGRGLASFAMTEPEAGSAVRRIAATALPDGRGGWRLRGSKIWIGSAAWASALNVFVRLAEPGSDAPGEVTGFVVRRQAKGLRLGPEALTMGLRGMAQSVVHLEDVAVGPDDLLGRPGGGAEPAEDAMQITRLGLAAMSIGGMKRCAQLIHRYASRRTVATGRLLDNPLTLVRLSDLAAAIDAVEALVAMVTVGLDEGRRVPEEAFLALKTSGPEYLWQAADLLVQTLGGRGYIETNEASRILRDARVFRIFEGPTEAIRMHLGSRVIHRGADLYRFLDKDLGAHAVSRDLERTAEEVRTRVVDRVAPFADRTAALRWACHLVGDLATAAFLLAAVEGAARRGDSACSRRAAEWARLVFERERERALGAHPGTSVLLDAEGVGAVIAGYRSAIGDVEQASAGEEHELDPLLRRAGEKQLAALLEEGTGDPAAAHSVMARPLAAERVVEPGASSGPRGSGSDPDAATIAGWISDWLARELGLVAGAIELDRPVAELGIDSVLAVSLAQVLEDRLGRSLEATLLWRFSTIDSLARHLAGENATPPAAVESLSGPDETPALSTAERDLSEGELARLLAAEIAAARERGTRDETS